MVFGFFKRPRFRVSPFGYPYASYADADRRMEDLSSALRDHMIQWSSLHPEDQVWYAGWYEWKVDQLTDAKEREPESAAFFDWRIRELAIPGAFSPKARKIEKRQLEQRLDAIREIEARQKIREWDRGLREKARRKN